MVELIKILLVLCMITGNELDGTQEQERWFESGGIIIYPERMFGIWGFPFLPSWLIHLYSHMLGDFGNKPSTVVLFLDWKLEIQFKFNHNNITDFTYIKPCPLYSNKSYKLSYRM